MKGPMQLTYHITFYQKDLWEGYQVSLCTPPVKWGSKVHFAHPLSVFANRTVWEGY